MRIVAHYSLVQLKIDAVFSFVLPWPVCVFVFFLYNVCAMAVHSGEYRKPEGTDNYMSFSFNMITTVTKKC